MSSRNNKKNSGTIKNLISIGIYNGIIWVIISVIAIALGFIPVFSLFLPAIIALPAGVVVMLMLHKAPQKGIFIITGALIGLYMIIPGHLPVVALFCIAGGLLGEFIWYLSGRESFNGKAFGYAFVMVGYAAGCYLPMIFMRSTYIQLKASKGMDLSFYEKMLDMLTIPVLIASLSVTVITAYLGSIWGNKVVKKHFKSKVK